MLKNLVQREPEQDVRQEESTYVIYVNLYILYVINVHLRICYA